MQAYHPLYLPSEWSATASTKFPVIVEYMGGASAGRHPVQAPSQPSVSHSLPICLSFMPRAGWVQHDSASHDYYYLMFI